jgi:hypothetical protein
LKEVSAPTRPAHLLRFIHAQVDQEVGHRFGPQGADLQTGIVAFGIADQPGTLTGEILADPTSQGRKKCNDRQSGQT